MWINPFWFGVLLTVIGLIVLLFIIAFINVKRSESEDGEDVLMDEDAFKKMLSEAVRDALRENIVFGDPVEDRDDETH